jgi:predicted nucleotidyltransferase
MVSRHLLCPMNIPLMILPARGEFRPDSDIDLLIIKKETEIFLLS